MGLFPPVHLLIFEMLSQLSVARAFQNEDVDFYAHILVKIEEKYT